MENNNNVRRCKLVRTESGQAIHSEAPDEAREPEGRLSSDGNSMEDQQQLQRITL